MKNLFFSFLLLCAAGAANAQSSNARPAAPDTTKQVLTVDASCGQCRFNLKGNGCDLAVRIGGKAYFVDGAHIDSFGDAHAEDGFCNAVRKAQVQGAIVKGRFKATYFQLVDTAAKKENLP